MSGSEEEHVIATRWPDLGALVTRLRGHLRQNERLRATYASFDLFRKYGTTRPERVPIHGSPHAIYVDSSEPRGQALARNFCSGQPQLKALWRTAIERLRPEVVLDVGANYGELVFMPSYRPGVLVVAVEPHPSLSRYLERARAEHPHGAAIELVFAAASDADGGELTFFVDDAWSGRSSAVRTYSQREVREVRVPVTSIDAIVGDRARGKTLLFKIDVEGFEPNVLAGMHLVLGDAAMAVGLVELHRRNLSDMNIDLVDYLADLERRFTVYAFGEGGAILRVPPGDFPRLFPDPESSTDLILLSERSLARRLELPGG